MIISLIVQKGRCNSSQTYTVSYCKKLFVNSVFPTELKFACVTHVMSCIKKGRWPTDLLVWWFTSQRCLKEDIPEPRMDDYESDYVDLLQMASKYLL